MLEEAKTKITKSKYTPDLPFPEEQGMQEGKRRLLLSYVVMRNINESCLQISSVLGNVYENVIFFGDFLLRMPDMIKKVLVYNTNDIVHLWW